MLAVSSAACRVFICVQHMQLISLTDFLIDKNVFSYLESTPAMLAKRVLFVAASLCVSVFFCLSAPKKDSKTNDQKLMYLGGMCVMVNR